MSQNPRAPDGFKHWLFEILSFVEDHHRAPAGASISKQNLIQLLAQAHDIVFASVDVKIGQQVAEKFARVALCMEQEEGTGGTLQLSPVRFDTNKTNEASASRCVGLKV